MSASPMPLPQDRPRRGLDVPTLVAAGLVGAAIIASFAPSFVELVRKWEGDPNYSHGWLVAPIAALILWMRKDELAATAVRPSWLGWPILGALLALRYALFERNETWAEQALIPPVVAAVVLGLCGWRILLKAAPAIAFLWFMLPLPPSINAILAQPLQRLATICSTTLLQALGLPVLAEGNIIIIGADRLEVARACNGLSMMLSFVTLITATVLTVARDRPIWERAVLFLSTVPIALVSNILRIAATAGVYHWKGAEVGEKIAHDTAGWAMMPIALVLVWVELRLLSWVVVEEEVATRPMVVMPTLPGMPAPGIKPAKPAGPGAPDPDLA